MEQMQHPGTSWILVALLVLSVATALSAGEPEAPQILDMTYVFDSSSIYWPTATSFTLTQVARGINEAGWWYASNDFAASEHGGTHADAPIHFVEDGRSIDQVPLQEWIGPAVKIDVVASCKKDRDYLLRVADIIAWEEQHGRIPDGAWVIMYTGIDTAYYPDRKGVLGTDKTGPAALGHLHFPGFSPESVELLISKRSITGIAIDTPSIDYGRSKDFKAHQILCGAGKLAVENIANLDQLPPVGATLYVVPMPIRGGTGAPTRVFAVLP